MSIHTEANLVDLCDEQLKEYLGHTYHAIKNLEEEKKNDPDVQQMRQALADYIKDNFDDQLKDLKKAMKAARALAGARGIKWKNPTDADYARQLVKEALEGIRNPDGKGETKVFVGFAGEPLKQIGGPKE